MTFIKMNKLFLVLTLLLYQAVGPKILNERTFDNSVTFIVGIDKNTENPFYSMAAEFFYTNPKHKTELIIHDFSSLEEIINFLNLNKPSNGKNWEVVNIVNHSSEFGLNMPLYKGGENLTTKEWQIHSQNKNHRLPAFIKYIGQDSLITFWGCSFGNQESHLFHLSKIFKGENGNAQIRSPNKRLFFYKDEMSHHVKHFYTDEYSLFSHSLRFDNKNFPLLFKQKYPNKNIKWENVTLLQNKGDMSNTYYSATEIKIKFYIPLAVLKTYHTLSSFMLAQPEITKTLNDRNISLHDLNVDILPTDDDNVVLLLCKTLKHSILQKSLQRENDIFVYANPNQKKQNIDSTDISNL